MSPHFAALILRTLCFAWANGTRFHRASSDIRKCVFCGCGPESLPHIIACPSLLVPLHAAVNLELKARGICLEIQELTEGDFINFSPIPSQPSSAAYLLPLAASCDLFHNSRGFLFANGKAREQYIRGRVQVLFSRFGTKFWNLVAKDFPSSFAPPFSLGHPRRRKLRSRPSRLFSSFTAAPPPSSAKCGDT